MHVSRTRFASTRRAIYPFAVVADGQSAGRGRSGRQFQSPRGKGVYLSLLLRPDLPPQALLPATGMAAVAACDAVERCCGVRPRIKWTNDLLLAAKKSPAS